MASLGLPLLSLAWFGLAVSGGTSCAPEPVAEAAGPLAVSEPTIDFGAVQEGRILEHEWTLAVRAPVEVRSAKTDCGCTLARLEREGAGGRAAYELGSPLVPGESLHVSARYDTRGRRGPSTRSVNLSHTAGVLTLGLAADVKPWLISDPHDLPFTRAMEGAGAECSFRVRAASGESFGLSATHRGLPPWITLALEAETPDAAGRAPAWRVRATLAPETPRGTFSYPLEIESDVLVPEPYPTKTSAASTPATTDPSSTVPSSTVEARHFSLSPAWGLQVVGPVALSSPTLEFGVVGVHDTVAQSLRLESFDSTFEPRDARARLEPLKPGEDFPLARTAQVHVRPAGSVCEIELVFAGLDPAVSGTFLGKLVVETGHPRLPRLEALVRGVASVPEGAPSHP